MEEAAKYLATPTAFMRVTKIKFNRVVPAHLIVVINDSYPGGQLIGPACLIQLSVAFHESGEVGAVRLRSNGYTLGVYLGAAAHNRGFHQGAFMALPPEAVAYLSHAAEEAIAIVAPLVTNH